MICAAVGNGHDGLGQGLLGGGWLVFTVSRSLPL